MIRRAIIALCLLAATARGQWATNAWPAWQHPRAGRQQALDAYGAVWERDNAWRVNGTTSSLAYPSFWRSQRANAIATKTSLKTALTQYAAATNATEELARVKGAFNAATNAPSSAYPTGVITNWSVATICAAGRFPTNLFDYTPWRCLDGLGPFTNDASVGRPHGWDVTANGGTNFPAGRTNWYTTDYGWDNIKKAANMLTLVVRSSATHTATTNAALVNDGVNTTWEDAKQGCTNAASAVFASGSGGRAYSLFPGVTNWTARKNIVAYDMGATAARMTNALTANILFRTQSGAPTVPTETLYDDFSTGYTNRGAWVGTNLAATYTPYGWQVETNIATTVTGGVYAVCSTLIGVTNFSAVTWCDDPAELIPSPGLSAVRYRGFAVQRSGGGLDGTYFCFVDLSSGFLFKP